jgi:hypothetical protein
LAIRPKSFAPLLPTRRARRKSLGIALASSIAIHQWRSCTRARIGAPVLGDKAYKSHQKSGSRNRQNMKRRMRFGFRLMPELYEQFSPMVYETALQAAEQLAEDLRAKGFGVVNGICDGRL